MNSYVTLDQVRRYLGLDSAHTADDDLLLMLMGAASRLIDAYTGRRFYPSRAVQPYTYHDPGVLLLDDDLLALHTLTNGDGAAITAYHLQPSSTAVKSSIVLDRGQAIFTYENDPVDAILVDATWGYHPCWPNVWKESGDSVMDNPLSADAATLTVSDAGALDPGGSWKRFAAGQLIRLGEEYAQVLRVDTLANTLTVERGANGTTAAGHAQGTAISIYQPPDDVRQVCLRVTGWLYKQKDAGFVQMASSLRGQIAVPPALPQDVQQILAPYVRIKVG